MSPFDASAAGGLVVEPATAAQLSALIAGSERFEQEFGLSVMPGYIEFEGALAYSLEQITTGGIDPEWMSYLFIDTDDQALVGLGGFKGPPDDGVAEIGYGIAPSHRRRGLATKAASELVERARVSGVSLVIAHTLAEENASTRVLLALSFEQTETLRDPDAGAVWRWELPLGP